MKASDLPDMDTLFADLVPAYNITKDVINREELISLIEDYFGEEDARLVLAIALYFKRPVRYGWLYQEIKKKLEEIA